MDYQFCMEFRKETKGIRLLKIWTTVFRIWSLPFLIYLTFLMKQDFAFAQISHLELGAANYGMGLDEGPRLKGGTSKLQFLVLEQTLSDLVSHYGPSGVVYLNDIDPEGLKMAQTHAEDWLKARGLENQIKIELLPGDYSKIDFPVIFKSAHLTNPNYDQLASTEDKHAMARLAAGLERIASHSQTGLVITTYYYRINNFRNQIWHLANALTDSTFISTNKAGYRYLFPDGSDEPLVPKVFIIKSNSSCEELLKDLAINAPPSSSGYLR